MPTVGASQEIVAAIVSYLQTAHGKEAGVALLLDRLRDANPAVDEPSAAPPHGKELARDYLDHHHRAPEFYLNLTGPSSWRFDFGDWVELAAGSVVWNDPGRVHATRSGSSPWLSVWAWLSDIDQPCEVVRPPAEQRCRSALS